MRALVLIAGLLAMASAAAEEPWALDPVSLPWLPHLVTNNDPAVCATFERTLVDEFLRTGNAALPEDVERLSFRTPDFELPWSETGQESHSGWYSVLDVDANGDGDNELVVRRLALRSGYEYLELIVFETRESLDAEAAKLVGFGELFNRSPSVIGLDYLINEDAAFVKLSDRPFLYRRQIRRLDRLSRAATLELVHENRLVPVCIAEIAPSLSDPVIVSTLPDVRELLALLVAIGGVESPGCGGASRYDMRILQTLDQTLQGTSTAPWRNLDHDNEGAYRHELRSLVDWGTQSIWNWRQINALAVAVHKAEAPLVSHYRSAFDMLPEAAAAAAHRTITQLVTAAFHFVSGPFLRELRDGFPDALDVYLTPDYLSPEAVGFELGSEGAAPQVVRTLLQRTLLLGADVDPILPRLQPNELDGEAMEPLLSFAIDHPDAMARLVAAGADSDARNVFGKTALMYAAQLGTTHAAETLLGLGADPNLATLPYSNCGRVFGSDTMYDVTTVRTALDYAIQSGSQEMIDLLRAHGAKTAEELAAETRDD